MGSGLSLVAVTNPGDGEYAVMHDLSPTSLVASGVCAFIFTHRLARGSLHVPRVQDACCFCYVERQSGFGSEWFLCCALRKLEGWLRGCADCRFFNSIVIACVDVVDCCADSQLCVGDALWQTLNSRPGAEDLLSLGSLIAQYFCVLCIGILLAEHKPRFPPTALYDLQRLCCAETKWFT